MSKVNEASRQMYKKYARLVSFKSLFFANQIEPSDQIIVEVLSGPGENFDCMRKYIDLSEKTIICIDQDLDSLKRCREKGYYAIRADVNVLPLKKNSVDVILCNSFHHIPDTAKKAIKEQVLPALRPGGKLIGIEANGIIPFFIIKMISFLPHFLAKTNLILHEFYKERNEIISFLKLKFADFIAGFKGSYIRKSLIYLFYKIQKDELERTQLQ